MHRRDRRRWLVLVHVVAALACLPAAAAAQQQQFQFFISASDASGAPVTNLRADEVVVTENGAPASVIRMQPINWPVKVTVMVDNGLGTSQYLVQYRNGLKEFFAALPTGVEASLLTLSPQPRWIVRPTNDRVQLARGVDLISPDGGAQRFIDALIEVADRIDKENREATQYFPVIVMLSTTGAEGSSPRDRDMQRMVEQFLRHSARIHVVMLGITATSPNQVVGARQVHVGKLLSDETGGRYEAIAAQTAIPNLLGEFGEMVAKAHAFQSQQYLVTVERPEGRTGPLGELALGVTRPGLTFAATQEGLMP